MCATSFENKLKQLQLTEQYPFNQMSSKKCTPHQKKQEVPFTNAGFSSKLVG
jgi:hypothetical protein